MAGIFEKMILFEYKAIDEILCTNTILYKNLIWHAFGYWSKFWMVQLRKLYIKCNGKSRYKNIKGISF